MIMKRLFLAAFFTLLTIGFAHAQGGNLEFNQAIIMTVNSGQLTVPAGKVWKVTASSSGSSVYYSPWTSNTTFTWSLTNPDPCTGATAGSASLQRIYKRQCPDANNKVIVNGKKYTLATSNPLWLPETTTIELSSTPCVNSVSSNIPANTPYYLQDVTSGASVYYVECDGPINQGSVENGIIVSILEFNVIP
jgi:hypothetical protein